MLDQRARLALARHAIEPLQFAEGDSPLRIDWGWTTYVVNDTWGHNTGDQIIRFVAGVLQAAASNGQLVARHGGEEFAIVAENTPLEDAAELAEHARASIESKILRRRTTNESLGKVTASFGVAQYQPEEARWQFFERADSALYESKTAGRNRVSRAGALRAAS